MENEESEKTEMEVGVRGGVYNVSNVDGVPKIIPKSQSTTSGNTQSKTVITIIILIINKIDSILLCVCSVIDHR